MTSAGEVDRSATDQVTDEIARLLLVAAQGEQARNALQAALGLKHTRHFRKAYLIPALDAGMLEMTQPDKLARRSQRYRLTEAGLRMKETLVARKKNS